MKGKVKKWVEKTGWKNIIAVGLMFLVISYFVSVSLSNELDRNYQDQFSVLIKDRSEESISRSPNPKGHYLKAETELPEKFAELLVRKEDRFFYYHFGVNPVSLIRGVVRLVIHGNAGGSSTISQQLVKILLGNESERTFSTKLTELAYTIALETHKSKAEILSMYGASVYLGNQVQGFAEASEMYFGKNIESLTEAESLKLLATISSPSNQNPWKSRNDQVAGLLAKNLNVDISLSEISKTKKNSYDFQSESSFEIKSLGVRCGKSCSLTIDENLTEKLREILRRNVNNAYEKGARNGAIVVIKVPENELLAVVGSPNPQGQNDGSQINMAKEPRPIGSTVKPFIYLRAFEKGVRPYTKVDDREYKYLIATGFPLYPKNYDGEYRGEVSIHEALSNSLNVPTVKTLEFIGLEDFYNFLEQRLGLIPIQDLDSYQLGIALGGLETDLMSLTHFFTIFPNDGFLKPLKIFTDEEEANTVSLPFPPHAKNASTQKVSNLEYIQLINKILSDRDAGVEEFGSKSNLNLTQGNYAVKTGTSRDFHDSWVVGYTPDFVVGVWLGNSENTPLKELSGQSGAGRIWRESMELIFGTEYNKKTPFKFDKIISIQNGGEEEYGLPSDVFEKHVSLLEDNSLITSPHDGDMFEFFNGISIPLESSEVVKWYVNGNKLGEGKSVRYEPQRIGSYEIQALSPSGRKEFIKISLNENQ